MANIGKLTSAKLKRLVAKQEVLEVVKGDLNRSRYKIIVERKQIATGGAYFLILPNTSCGHSGRYTVCKIEDDGRTRIVGRELNLAFAKKHAQRLANKLKWKIVHGEDTCCMVGI